MRYILRGLKENETPQQADIGMNNILGIGRYISTRNAWRYLYNETAKLRAKKNYARVAMYNDDGCVGQGSI